ncbi:TadE-like protein [Haloactinospora alba]|uniref:TadE-like protein n=1 Tax=Haloactinospora alba TaxID=405555 RepID=A0A543NGJ8_9ACTN|nr:TadE/TadG family type IV pilus assembly protein [Haloactinospora alba]TQN30933.1 TadE-like protein [Haloactinospora alba]
MPHLRSLRPSSRRRGDRGAQMVEFAAYLPIVLLVVVLVMEAFFTFTAIERIESAARAGARVAGEGGFEHASATARQSLPGWLDDAVIHSGRDGNGGVYTEVSVNTPLMWKNAPLTIELNRRVEMPTV